MTNNEEALLVRITTALERLATAAESIAKQGGNSTSGTSSQTSTNGSSQGGATGPYTGPTPTNFPNYGRSKGEPIAGATTEDLEYYATGARRTLADPSKSRWHPKEQALLAAIEAEIARPTDPSFGEPPPDSGPTGPTDEDIPF